MPRRPPKTDPELQAHKEWLGYLQPRGLMVAPKGESSGHLTFNLAELAEVNGRAMFAGRRLVDVIEASRTYQAVVSEELAEQVLAGLWQLLRGFQRANQLTTAGAEHCWATCQTGTHFILKADAA
jgi:hypothetical protein